MTTTSTFKIVAIGDLHFGNPKLRAEELYAKLTKYLYPALEDTQLLLLTGDTYDQLTTVNSSANRYVLKFIQDIYSISSSTGMQIRILHGTYTHDRDQVSIFNNLELPYTRTKVIDKITCEELSHFNDHSDTKLRMLYIPDNLQYKHSSEVMKHVADNFKCLGWDKADIVLGHGSFDYALGCSAEHLPECTYTIDQFKPFIDPNGLIIMGHIHRPSHKANVYYCGSFDRMAHGEEEDKGFYTFYRDGEKWASVFTVNADANLFVTIEPQGNDIETRINSLLTQMHNKFTVPRGYVRVLYNNPEDRGIYQKVCFQAHPNIFFSGKRINETDDNVFKLDELNIDTFTDVKPNMNNLGELAYQFLIDNSINPEFSKDVIVTKVQQLLAE